MKLRDILATAEAYWSSKGASSRMMPIRARRCAALLKADLGKVPDTSVASGTALLAALATDGLSKGSQGSYYAAYRRALALSGIQTFGWPNGPSAPRRVRDALSGADIDRIRHQLIKRGERETAHLVDVLRGTGMRVDVEALSWDAWVLDHKRDTLKVVGKGGHERVIPLPHMVATLLWSREEMAQMRRLRYSAHLKRLKRATTELGITSRLPTFHAIRHHYATEAYRKSGRNLRVVQELLGHADIATTARYVGVDMAELRSAVS